MGDHGRFIPIDRESYLQVFVKVQNSETIRESIDEAVGFILRNHEEKKARAEVVSMTYSRLGGVSGRRLRLKYVDAKTGKAAAESIQPTVKKESKSDREADSENVKHSVKGEQIVITKNEQNRVNLVPLQNAKPCPKFQSGKRPHPHWLMILTNR